MTPENQTRRSLLGNDPVNTFPLQRIRKQQSSNFCCYAPALYTRLTNSRETVFALKVVETKGSFEKNWVEFRDAS
jgi:hypothetical protein